MADIDLDELISALQGVKKTKDDEAVAAMLNRKFSMADLKEAWANASDEEKAEFRELFGGTPVQVASESPAEDEPETKPKPKPKAKPKEEAPKRVRQGRRTGQVYAFDVDEGGQVIPLDVARVYQGDDEDDEVEIPEAPEPADDEEGAAA